MNNDSADLEIISHEELHISSRTERYPGMTYCEPENSTVRETDAQPINLDIDDIRVLSDTTAWLVSVDGVPSFYAPTYSIAQKQAKQLLQKYIHEQGISSGVGDYSINESPYELHLVYTYNFAVIQYDRVEHTVTLKEIYQVNL